MTDFKHIQNVYFIGIGGIGMSALARYFRSLGKNVAGYDKTGSTLTTKLQEEGIQVLFSDRVEDLPRIFTEDKHTLVVYTPAIPGEHMQYNFFRDNDYTLLKRAAVLGMITRGIYTLAVAGTHGKTTTTAILAYLLKETGAKVTAFLGGISENYQSNLVLAGNEVMVVEADEFDRSFLQLSPNIAAVTSMDADHLDIYGENEHLQQSFLDFTSLVPQDGSLFFRNGLPLEGTSVGIADGSGVVAENIRVENGSYLFDLVFRGERISGFRLQLPGKHNLLNAVTALAMAIEYGSPKDALAEALSGFKGVHRRFTYKINTDDLVLIDDYAHHPAEIAAVHQAVREMHPGKKVLAVFQPHLFSRTRDFAADFAESLDLFDEVMLLDIYPAREIPLEGITSSWLLEKVRNNNKRLVSKEELGAAVRESDAQVVVMMGAGDIGEEVDKTEKILRGEN